MPPKRKREAAVAASGVPVKREAAAPDTGNSVSSDRLICSFPNAASELDIQGHVASFCGLTTGALLALAIGVGTRMSALIAAQQPVEGARSAVTVRVLRCCVPAVSEAVSMLSALERMLTEHLHTEQ
jgi:hypothetical protein